jgi:predicted dehydrogenase
VRFAFVGLGRAARVFHLPALRLVPGTTVVGGCDADPVQRQAWTAATNTPAYETLEELLEKHKVDALVVATPPSSHADICVAALDAGLHVYCEKPFVQTVDEADRVIAAAEAAGRIVAVNHEFRAKPIFTAIQDGVASGRYGRLVFCQIWQLMELAPWNEPTAWRAGMANRTLLEGGVHLVDLMLTIFGERPVSVTATHSAGFHEQRDADAVHLVTTEFPHGRLAQITIDRLCPAGTRYLEVRADCEQASLRASLGGRAVVQAGMKRAEKTGVRVDFAPGGLAWAEQGLRRTTLAKAARDAGVQGTAALLRGFVEAAATGAEPPSSAREARQGLEVIEAAYRSASTGRRIELTEVAEVARG